MTTLISPPRSLRVAAVQATPVFLGLRDDRPPWAEAPSVADQDDAPPAPPLVAVEG